MLDTVSIIPNSLVIEGVPSLHYKLAFASATLIWLTKPATPTVIVTYRTFPYMLQRSVQLYNYDSIKNNFLLAPYIPKQDVTSTPLFDFGSMEYTGSFGRGISFGNAQDAVLNSNLNLQLNGYIADSIQIAAVLSDQNLPIQPDGSTTQLNEIDRIYIQLKKKNWALSLGDIDLRQNKQYYLNFYKRLQGVSFETTNAITSNITNTTLVSGALARGKFSTNLLQGLEGNQGPYRLQGANNEFFFIVLANTERVYIDGELMQRGEDQDYIINYNTAEITFTPQRLITKDKRIRIEFEYSDRNYINSQVYATTTTTINNKLAITISGYNNIDAKNSPINQTLNAAQKNFLGTVGDSIQKAFFPVITRDTLSPGKILYKPYDTLVNSVLTRIYIYSTNADSARFNLSFTDVGQGLGNYNLLLNGANGKAYVWISPVAGMPQGKYEPVQYLVTPKKQQLISTSIVYTAKPNSVYSAEVATSVVDVNTFSNKDKKNDQGFASKVGWAYYTQLTTKLKLKTDLATELNNKNFRTIERLRTPEFNRDWNLPIQFTPSNENLSSAAVTLSTDLGNTFGITTQYYTRDNSYKGIRQALNHAYNYKGWQLVTNVSYTSTRDSMQRGSFIRPTIDLAKTLPKLKHYRIAINYFADENKLLQTIPDSLNLLSIGFSSTKFTIASNEAKDNKWTLSYMKRNNKIPVAKQLLLSDKSDDVEANLALLSNPAHKLLLRATYRKLNVLFPQKVSYKSDETLLGRAEYNINEWKGLLTGNVLYETGSGQEQRRDFAFLEVPAGQGEYYWIDYNSNNVQEINEFELAQFPDQRKFIRIFIPTNIFIKANFNTFNYGLAINPRTYFSNPKYIGIKNIISRTYLQSSLQISKKQQSNQAVQLNPFKYDITSNALLNLTRAFTNSLSYNKYNSKWGIDVNQDERSNRALLTYGYETRQSTTYTLKGRLNINNLLLLESTNKQATNALTTPSFNNRNYKINALSTENKISYTQKTLFRISTFYQLEQKQNELQLGGEKAIVNSLGAEGKYNALQSAAITAKMTYSNIKYTGNTNSTVSYIMLDALVPGRNYLWNVDLIKTLKSNVEISIRYEGRKTGTLKTVHIGSATMRATFY